MGACGRCQRESGLTGRLCDACYCEFSAASMRARVALWQALSQGADPVTLAPLVAHLERLVAEGTRSPRTTFSVAADGRSGNPVVRH